MYAATSKICPHLSKQGEGRRIRWQRELIALFFSSQDRCQRVLTCVGVSEERSLTRLLNYGDNEDLFGKSSDGHGLKLQLTHSSWIPRLTCSKLTLVDCPVPASTAVDAHENKTTIVVDRLLHGRARSLPKSGSVLRSVPLVRM